MEQQPGQDPEPDEPAAPRPGDDSPDGAGLADSPIPPVSSDAADSSGADADASRLTAALRIAKERSRAA